MHFHSKYHNALRLLIPCLLVITLSQFGALRQVSAAVVLSFSLEQLVQEADLVVLGSCVETTGAWDADKKVIFTYITLALEECLKGDPCPTPIRIQQLGGKVGEVLMTVTGAPKFYENERVILFLKKSSSNYYHVAGLAQGKYSVIQRGEAFYVKRNLAGLTLVKKSGPTPQLQSRNEPEEEVNLQRFIKTIQSYLR